MLGPLDELRVRRGAVIRFVAADDLVASIGPTTRMVAISHVLWTTGRILPLPEIADAAQRRRGAAPGRRRPVGRPARPARRGDRGPTSTRSRARSGCSARTGRERSGCTRATTTACGRRSRATSPTPTASSGTCAPAPPASIPGRSISPRWPAWRRRSRGWTASRADGRRGSRWPPSGSRQRAPGSPPPASPPSIRREARPAWWPSSSPDTSRPTSSRRSPSARCSCGRSPRRPTCGCRWERGRATATSTP